MPLTRKEKQRIYEEELERIKARKCIEAQQYHRQEPSRIMNWTIIVGFLLMLYVLLGGR